MALARQCDLCGQSEPLQTLPTDVDISEPWFCGPCITRRDVIRHEIYEQLSLRFGGVVRETVAVVSLLELARDKYLEEFRRSFGPEGEQLLLRVLEAMRTREVAS